MSLHYTGTQVNYFFVCQRKLWLFSHHITMEHTSDVVKMGKLIGQESYDREKKDIQIDDTISIDFLELRHNKIHEVKKSRAVEEAHIWQVKYYLFYLEQKGLMGVTAEINYPLLRKKMEILLNDEDRLKMIEVLDGIGKIMRKSKPPEKIDKRFCRKCSYFEFCWV